MTEHARIFRFPTGEDITAQMPASQRPELGPHAPEIIKDVEEKLAHHEYMARVYRRWLGKQAIEDELRERISDLYDVLEAMRSKDSAKDINPEF